MTELVGGNMSLLMMMGKDIYERGLMHQASSLTGPEICKTVHKDFEPDRTVGRSRHSGMA
jgi:hypothetical protein